MLVSVTVDVKLARQPPRREQDEGVSVKNAAGLDSPLPLHLCFSSFKIQIHKTDDITTPTILGADHEKRT